jgi:hypothetical protein
VCDTGPILHLAEAEALVLLKHAAPILVPPAVEAEMQTLRTNWRADPPAGLKSNP